MRHASTPNVHSPAAALEQEEVQDSFQHVAQMEPDQTQEEQFDNSRPIGILKDPAVSQDQFRSNISAGGESQSKRIAADLEDQEVMIVNSNKGAPALNQNLGAGLDIQDQQVVIPAGADAQVTGPQPFDPDHKSQKSTHFAEVDPDAGLREAMNIQDDPLDIDMEWSGIMNLYFER